MIMDSSSSSFFFFFLHTLPSTIAFRLECVLFYQLYAEITKYFDEERLGSVPI